MPKQKVVKQDVLEAALQLIREQGIETVNARSIAGKMCCSVQPIYSYYASMDDLKEAVFAYAQEYLNSYIAAHADKKRYFASIGKCHVSFAAEEKYLFQFLYLSKYKQARSFEEVYQKYAIEDVTKDIEARLGLTEKDAKDLYMDMMVYTHGIACMLATGAASLPYSEILCKVDNAYHSFYKRLGGKCNETDYT